MSKEYTNGEITIKWQPKLCQHSAICAENLPKVYNPKASPWIAIKNASTEELKKTNIKMSFRSFELHYK
jgi:uncharacterized Fe-S cluster protein YjdI